MYSERAYFDGDHCHHCAARDEHERLVRLRGQADRQMRERRRTPRGVAPVLRLV